MPVTKYITPEYRVQVDTPVRDGSIKYFGRHRWLKFKQADWWKQFVGTVTLEGTEYEVAGDELAVDPETGILHLRPEYAPQEFAVTDFTFFDGQGTGEGENTFTVGDWKLSRQPDGKAWLHQANAVDDADYKFVTKEPLLKNPRWTFWLRQYGPSLATADAPDVWITFGKWYKLRLLKGEEPVIYFGDNILSRLMLTDDELAAYEKSYSDLRVTIEVIGWTIQVRMNFTKGVWVVYKQPEQKEMDVPVWEITYRLKNTGPFLMNYTHARVAEIGVLQEANWYDVPPKVNEGGVVDNWFGYPPPEGCVVESTLIKKGSTGQEDDEPEEEPDVPFDEYKYRVILKSDPSQQKSPMVLAGFVDHLGSEGPAIVNPYDISDQVKSINVTFRARKNEGPRAAKATIVLRNWAHNLKIKGHERIWIDVRHRTEIDGVLQTAGAWTRVFTGWITRASGVQQPPGVPRDQSQDVGDTVQLQCESTHFLMKKKKCVGFPAGDGKVHTDYVREMLTLAMPNLPDGMIDIEYSDTELPRGAEEENKIQPKNTDSFANWMSKLCRYTEWEWDFDAEDKFLYRSAQTSPSKVMDLDEETEEPFILVLSDRNNLWGRATVVVVIGVNPTNKEKFGVIATDEDAIFDPDSANYVGHALWDVYESSQITQADYANYICRLRFDRKKRVVQTVEASFTLFMEELFNSRSGAVQLKSADTLVVPQNTYLRLISGKGTIKSTKKGWSEESSFVAEYVEGAS